MMNDMDLEYDYEPMSISDTSSEISDISEIENDEVKQKEQDKLILSQSQNENDRKQSSDDEEEEDIDRQMAELIRRKAERNKQKEMKKYASNVPVIRDELIQEEEEYTRQNLDKLEKERQELMELIHIKENQIADEQERGQSAINDLRNATDEHILGLYVSRQGQEQEEKKTTKKTTTKTKKPVSEDVEPKKKRERSNIVRDVNKTFENCHKIVIEETFEEYTASMTLRKQKGKTNWTSKGGAWIDEDGVSYDSPNDAWKVLIQKNWGDAGLKKFNGANVWDKVGRLVATTNTGRIVDMKKNPFSVMLVLEKCKGIYNGIDFTYITPRDFTQLE